MARWIVQMEVATETNPRHPDFSGLDIIMAAPVTATGRASCPKFDSWITEKMKGRSVIWRNESLYREGKWQIAAGFEGDGKGKGKGKVNDNSTVSPKKPKRGASDGGGDICRRAAMKETSLARPSPGLIAPSRELEGPGRLDHGPRGVLSRDRRHRDPFPLHFVNDKFYHGPACRQIQQVIGSIRSLS